MPPMKIEPHIMAIDCCEHILAALRQLPDLQLTAVASKNNGKIVRQEAEIYLIVIAVSRYPVRRLYVSQLRRVYPEAPLLVLRREEIGGGAQRIRGEFILSDQSHLNDFKIVQSLRSILPFETCEHVEKGTNYDIVRDAIRVILEKYSDPDLGLARVAKAIRISPVRLSRILNQQVGVSFRQMLRHVRIEEAKRMLASTDYSVKQVASRVGFSDSHYFSRSFREMTGLSASEHKVRDTNLG